MEKSLNYVTSNNEITHPDAKPESEFEQAYKVPDKLKYKVSITQFERSGAIYNPGQAVYPENPIESQQTKVHEGKCQNCSKKFVLRANEDKSKFKL